MSKHTIGPWLVDFELDDLDSRSSILRVLDPRSLDHPQGPLVIANINAAAHAPHLDEPLHNARLIAAAPDLLDALKYLTEFIEQAYPNATEWVRYTKARAAIAKATGEQA